MKALYRIALSLALTATVSAAGRYRNSHPIHTSWASDRIGYDVVDARREGSGCALRRIELRLYHEYRNGFIIRTWQIRVPVFLGCSGLY